MDAGPTRDSTRPPPRTFSVVLAAVVLLAFGLRVVEILAGTGGLGESVMPGFDESVYVGAAWLARRGTLPYRDFVFVFPPGFLLVLWPVAQLASWFGGPALALTLARVLAAGVGALNVWLIGRIGARWFGGAGGVFAAVLYATAPVVVQTEGAALQEPFVNLGVLLAVIVWAERPAGEPHGNRVVAAGLLIGAAVSVKLVAGIFLLPLLVVGPFVRPVLDRVRLVVAASVPVLLTGAAFAVVAGWRPVLDQVVLAQVLRPRDDTLLLRVDSMFPLLRGQLRFTTFLAGASGWLAVAAFGAACVAAIWRGGAQGRLWGATGITVTAVLLVTPSYYPHYAVLLAPAAALVIAWVVTRAVAAARAPSLVPATAVTVGLVLLVAAVGTSHVVTTADAWPVSLRELGGELGTIVEDRGRPVAGRVSKGVKRAPADTCIVAVRPQVLLDANRVPSADRRGHVLLDVFGSALLAARQGDRPPFTGSPATVPAVQADILRQSRDCEFIVYTPRACPGGRKDLAAATEATILAETRPWAGEGCLALRRRP